MATPRTATDEQWEDLVSRIKAKATSSDLSAVATSGSYTDLSNKPTIGNATLTIQKNGSTVNSFTANATSNVTANITVPTKTSELTNNSGFITASDDINGNAATATNATNDANGDQINSTYLKLSGGTMTGKLTSPQTETGTADDSYFQSRRFRGQGDAASYYHAIDFGYASHNMVDFYEYGGVWNFWKNTTSTATTDTANLALGITINAIKNKAYTYTFPNKTGTLAVTSDLPTIVQTTGNSTTNLMSQNAVTSMIYTDPSTLEKIKIGKSAVSNTDYTTAIGNQSQAVGSRSTAIGNATQAKHANSVALGTHAETTVAGQVNIGAGSSGRGYNSSNYRLLSGVYDPQDNHDAATKAYVDAAATSVAAATVSTEDWSDLWQ